MKTAIIEEYLKTIDHHFVPSMETYKRAETRGTIRTFAFEGMTFEYAIITAEDAKGVQPIPGLAWGVPIPNAELLRKDFHGEKQAAIARGHYLLFIVEGDEPESAYEDMAVGAYRLMKNPSYSQT